VVAVVIALVVWTVGVVVVSVVLMLLAERMFPTSGNWWDVNLWIPFIAIMGTAMALAPWLFMLSRWVGAHVSVDVTL
jgi:hypothetical protein